MIKTSLGQHLLKKYNCRSCRNCRNIQIYSLFLGSVLIYPVFSVNCFLLEAAVKIDFITSQLEIQLTFVH